MAVEPTVARENRVKALNAIASSTSSRKDKAIREFYERRELYIEQLKKAEERYNYAPTRQERNIAEKAIEFINQRIREVDSNINYMRRFT